MKAKERPPPRKKLSKKFENPLTRSRNYDTMTTLKWTRKSPKHQKGIDNMTNKMTYVQALTIALETMTNEDAKERINALIDQLNKRNSAENRKPTKAQKENATLAEIVTEVLTNSDKALTISEIMQADERLSALSNQKVSAVVRGMGDKVAKTTEGRKSVFTLA